jgi:hypothetical protein|tara:strand:- start:1136 stop:1456 length:321 start_codon:yes stop_codon:yes gene_type:complete
MPDFSKMTKEQLVAYAEAATKAVKPLTIKVANGINDKGEPQKGGICVSGLISDRFPVTLTRNAWKALLTKEVAEWVLQFIQDNDSVITDQMALAKQVDREIGGVPS